jgi:hypothetical protein
MFHVYLIDLYQTDEWMKYTWVTGPFEREAAAEIAEQRNKGITGRYRYGICEWKG